MSSYQEETSGSIQQLYETLAAGNTVTMIFPEPTDAESFRVKFIKYKANQERSLVDIGFMEKEDFKAFSFRAKGEGVYEMCFRAKQPQKIYTFVVVKPEDNATS